MFNNSEYITSMVSFSNYPNKDNLPEFAFFGRSNVGKSSFINALTNRKNLARTSSEPGKTRTINFYLIDKSFFLLDFPGYGYAKHSRDTRAEFGKSIEEYLKKTQNLKIGFLLVDSKVGPTEDDILMYKYLQYMNVNIKIIATKIDRIGKTIRIRYLKQILEKLGITQKEDVIMTSSSTKEGLETVYKMIGEKI